MDFWAGTIGLVVFAFIEIVIFFWLFGSDKAWEEMNRGGLITIPRFFYYVTKYVTPVFLAVLIGVWFIEFIPKFIKNFSWQVMIARGIMLVLFVVFALMALRANNKGEVTK
jgi:NSS family neurotransmitter:Na+ symporter